MFLYFIIALAVGILAGTFTGLIPGIHINLVSLILLSFLESLSNIPSIILAIFIVSMAITHTFLDFIPSIFLGAPEEDSFLSILPGHQMLKKGEAHNAIILTLYGSIIGLIIILIFTPVFIYLLPLIFETSKKIIPFVLIFVSIYLILREKKFHLALIIFLLAGFLGYLALNSPVKEPLLPLLTGLFGSSALIISLKNKIQIPKQKITKLKEIKITKKEIKNVSLGAMISAPLSSFLPGIGAGHAAVIGSEIIPQTNRGFLTMLGAINTIVMGLSFITVFSIGRTRTGAALAVKQILSEITLSNVYLILTTIIISGILSFLIAIKISKIFSKNITKISYSKLSLTIILLLTTLITIFSNPLGLLVFATATSLGIFTILSGARRINLMGALLVPTILFYLF